MVRRLACAWLLWAGCSYTFDGSPTELPLVGAQPATALLPKLNHSPAGLARLMYGADGTAWTIFRETLQSAGGPERGLRLVHLSPPGEDTTFTAKKYFATLDAFYVFDEDPDGVDNPMVRLSITSVGAARPDGTWTFPRKPYICTPDNYDYRFLYYIQDKDTKTYQVIHRDNSFTRTLPIPDGIDPADPLASAQLVFNLDGSLLLVEDPMGHLIVHSTDDLHDYDLGKRSATFQYDDDHRLLITCGADGLRTASIDGGPDTVLDPAPCDENGTLFRRENGVCYTVGSQLRFVTRDGKGTPEVVLDGGRRFIAFGPQGRGQILFSTTPPDAFVNGAGDAWLGDWRFMERGLDEGFSRDGSELRWLEHAAQENGVGDLRAAEVPGGAARLLSRNVRQYGELRDGRVLAATNHAFLGTHNRVVVIDEHAGTQRWVADAAAEYVGIPGTHDVLIDVVSGPSTYDIVRVPIPPK